jgi:hypothetical protein
LFPLISEILGRSTFKGIPQLFAGTGKALLWNAEMAMGHAVFGAVRTLTAYARDWVTRGFFWLVGARIPASDPTFLLHRTQGLGVPGGYANEIDSQTALAILLAKMEEEQLLHFQAEMKALLELPQAKAKELLGPLYALLDQVGGIDSRARLGVEASLADIEKRHLQALAEAVQVRQEELARLIPAEGTPIRISETELRVALIEGTSLLETFFKERFFSQMPSEQIVQYWASKRLSAGDWTGLTRSLLRAALGEEALTPLSDTNSKYVRKIPEPRMGSFVDEVLATNQLPPKGQPKQFIDTHGAKPEFQVPTASALCAMSLAAYGRGMVLPAAEKTPEEKPKSRAGWWNWLNGETP